MYFSKKDDDKAVSDFNEAIRLKPNYAKAYYWRGRAYFSKKDYDIAISDLSEAIRLEPKYVEAYYWRGRVYFSKKDDDKAVSDFNEAIQLEPKDATAHYWRGLVYFSKKDGDKAVSDFNEAIRLEPKYVEAYYWRGRVYGVKGDRHRAIADYESALRIDPSHSNAQKALSDARNALENKTASPPVASNKQTTFYEPPAFYEQPTYKKPTNKQPKNKTSYSSSSESIDFSKYAEIGWQYIWDMHHFRWSYSWFYNTIGYKGLEDYNYELEWIVGVIYRKGISISITSGVGLFGGLGARHADYEVCDYGWCDTETDINMRHELGIELILGVFSLYIAERNFYRIGGGIGFIF